MHAWLTKPLDWCAIQFARRFVTVGSQSAPEAMDLAKVVRKWSEDGPVPSPPDFRLAADGSFQFASAVQTPCRSNNTVFGKLHRTGKEWMRQPTVILLHGWNAELGYRHLFPYLARRMSRLGINAAMIELPYHMQRRPREGPVVDFISSDVQGMLLATRQSIADTQALYGWLREQGVAAVGLWGFSLGAWLAGWISCSGVELHSLILTTPIVRIDRAIAELAFCEPVRRSLRDQSVSLSSLSLGSQRPCLEPKNILLMESRYDLFAPAETVEQLWEDWGCPEIWRLRHGHISVCFSLATLERAARWVGARG